MLAYGPQVPLQIQPIDMMLAGAPAPSGYCTLRVSNSRSSLQGHQLPPREMLFDNSNSRSSPCMHGGAPDPLLEKTIRGSLPFELAFFVAYHLQHGLFSAICVSNRFAFTRIPILVLLHQSSENNSRFFPPIRTFLLRIHASVVPTPTRDTIPNSRFPSICVSLQSQLISMHDPGAPALVHP